MRGRRALCTSLTCGNEGPRQLRLQQQQQALSPPLTGSQSMMCLRGACPTCPSWGYAKIPHHAATVTRAGGFEICLQPVPSSLSSIMQLQVLGLPGMAAAASRSSQEVLSKAFNNLITPWRGPGMLCVKT